MIEDKEFLTTLSQLPARPTRLEVGDKVTYTNDQGCVFSDKTIIGFKEHEGLNDRFIHIDTDCYWMPVKECSLELELSALLANQCDLTYFNLFFGDALREYVGFNVRFGGIDYEFTVPSACYPSNVSALKHVKDDLIAKLSMDNLTHITFKYHLLNDLGKGEKNK